MERREDLFEHIGLVAALLGCTCGRVRQNVAAAAKGGSMAGFGPLGAAGTLRFCPTWFHRPSRAGKGGRERERAREREGGYSDV